MKTVKLNNDRTIPTIGFGTWQITPDKAAKKAVLMALQAGYRLIDTAKIYGNEKGVGEALKESGVPRQELFITTKLWNSDQGYDSALKAFDESLDRLGLDYLDLYLIHWPASGKRQESYKALEEIYKSGRAKAIGVSNYTVRHLKEVLDVCSVVPAVNQVEFHPFLYDEQQELLDFCDGQNIIVEAYSPLAQAEQLDNPTLKQIAERYHKTPAQIMLRWAIQHGTVPIPRSSNAERIKQNLAVFDFKLSEADVATLNDLASHTRTAWDPSYIF